MSNYENFEGANALDGQLNPSSQYTNLMIISAEIAKFQEYYFKQLGLNQIFIIGGAVRSILDAYYHNEEPKIRDLDLAFVLDRQANEEEIVSLMNDAEFHCLGLNLSPELRKKNWSHPNDDTAEWGKKNHGYGFHLRTRNFPVVSISFYFYQEALDSLGFFTFDQIMIHLKNCEPLFESLVANNCIIDKNHSYQNWRNRELIFTNYNELKRDPLKTAFKAISAYAKLDQLSLPENLLQKIKSSLDNFDFQNISQFELVRSILKISNGANAKEALVLLRELGAIKSFPVINARLDDGNFIPWVREKYPFLDTKNP